jgi:hypothetical protein
MGRTVIASGHTLMIHVMSLLKFPFPHLHLQNFFTRS